MAQVGSQNSDGSHQAVQGRTKNEEDERPPPPPPKIPPLKRKADGPTGDSPAAEKKTFSMNIKSKPSSGVSINLGSNKSALGVNSTSPGIKMNIGGGSKKIVPVKMSLAPQPKEKNPVVQQKSKKVASIFNEDSESDEEEMPPEAKMRMRNLGRDTPTAAGPNSFGKSNLGFCDRQKMIERDIKRQMEEFGDKADLK